MALLHRASLSPTKLQLLEAWLPSRRWFQGQAANLSRVASYRFDDPAGAVGIESMLVRVDDGPVYQVPLTYRDAPLDNGDAWLIGNTEHSVLGRRWVYDACGDPVYANALASALIAGTGQAEEFVDMDGRLERRAPSMDITSSGGTQDGSFTGIGQLRRVTDDDPTLIVTDGLELAVVRRLDRQGQPGAAALSGRWDGLADPLTLAYIA